jgi:predicted RNA binding protein YcfA (HicA-like mRNA interferase family)
MPRKIRGLIQDLRGAGFYEIASGGKGSHRKFTHMRCPGAVTLSDDAKPCQEKQVLRAIERVKEWRQAINTTSGWNGVKRIRRILACALI